MTDWLKKYLKQLGLNDDDQGLLNRSMHSFRAGGAICRILEGEFITGENNATSILEVPTDSIALP